jgi:Holliday junction resolvasome RuvABC endonuclease subunit
MRILGLDQSLSKTGWCLLTGTRAVPLFECGHFGSEHALAFAVKLIELLDITHPAFVCWERFNPRVMVYGKKALFGGVTTPNADQLVLPQIAGMVEMACIMRALPYESVAVNTWRARVLGKGSGNLPKVEAKRRAVAACKAMGIKVSNADQAEAALIALYAMSCDRFRMLEHGLAKTAQNSTQSALD